MTARGPAWVDRPGAMAKPHAGLYACGGLAYKLRTRLGGGAEACTIQPAKPFVAPPAASILMLCAGFGEDGELLDVARGMAGLANRPTLGFIPANSNEDLAIDALRAGVKGYWKAWPSDGELLRFIAESQSGAGAARERSAAPVGLLPSDLCAVLDRLAPVRATTLITGETGVGKEVVANYLHAASGRSGPLIPLNCTALPDGLAESQLFGFERGAFTGATAARPGLFELADRGTILLDEIGDMPLSLQAKLLRTLEEGRVFRLGAARPVAVDVRVLAATNRCLATLVEKGLFRQDLYYRLSVAKVHIKPLRERPEMIEALANQFIARFNADYQASVEGVTAAALERMLGYSWPGNVRELRNAMESAIVVVRSGRIDAVDLPVEVTLGGARAVPVSSDERSRLFSALDCAQWNKSEAAKALGWSRMTLYRKMSKYQLAGSVTGV